MPEISQGTIEQAIQTTGDTVLRNELYFCDLDGLAGDGDFGNSLASGFRAIKAEWDAIPKTDIGAMLLKISMIVSKHVGGSSGPIWGTGFMKAAMLTRGKSEIALQDLVQMLGSAIEGIQARGGAKLGDKTLLDALIPIRDIVHDNAAKPDADPRQVLEQATQVANDAIEGTRGLVAKRGRQQFTGERSIGTPDPGIVAIATMLNDICATFGVKSPAQTNSN